MKRFIAILNGDSFINVPATRMQKEEDAILVWDGEELVAFVDVGCVLAAHMSDRKDECNG